jgi:hypothetical protein
MCKILGDFFKHFKDPKLLDIIFKDNHGVKALGPHVSLSDYPAKDQKKLGVLDIHASRENYPPEWYEEHIRTFPEIIGNLKKHFFYSEGQSANVYTCAAQRFDPNGTLRPEYKVNELQNVIDKKNAVLKQLSALERICTLSQEQLNACIENQKTKIRQLDEQIKSQTLMNKKLSVAEESLLQTERQIEQYKFQNKRLSNFLIDAGAVGLTGAGFFALHNKFRKKGVKNT